MYNIKKVYGCVKKKGRHEKCKKAGDYKVDNKLSQGGGRCKKLRRIFLLHLPN